MSAVPISKLTENCITSMHVSLQSVDGQINRTEDTKLTIYSMVYVAPICIPTSHIHMALLISPFYMHMMQMTRRSQLNDSSKGI